MNFDLIIVGAGLVGASLAASLRGSGLRIALIDGEPEPKPVGSGWDARVYAISPGSRDFLRACGAWERIDAARIARVEAMQVKGDANGAALSFSAYDAGRLELCFIVESRELQRALHEVNAGQDGLAMSYAAQPTELDFAQDSARLALSDRRVLEARLIVGADGAQSWVRQAAGIEVRERAYGQTGVVANFETERGHDAIARQWFRRDGVLALLPLPGNRVSMVWSTWDAAAERLLSLNAPELEREVEAASDFELGVLRLIDHARGFPLRLLRVTELVRPRLALVGDAAHNVHPLAGQGVNLGFQDAGELARVIKERGAQDDCGDFRLMRRYARARKEPIAAMQATTDGLQRLFNNNLPGVRWLRNAGLDLTDGIVPLKRTLVEHALG
jgi:2-octaprenylphenol hydroxylase